MYKEDFQIFDNYKKEQTALFESDIKDSKNETENKNRKKYPSDMIYLDSAASSLTPDIVVEKMNEYYYGYRSNIDRGLYKSAERATGEYEKARQKVTSLINANPDEVIFTASSTDSANKLVVMLETYFKNKKDDRNEILVSKYAHHSDLVPLQEYAKRAGKSIVLFDNVSDALSKMNGKTLLVSCPLASNVTGEIFDIKSLAAKAKDCGAMTVCDMTAAAGHIIIDASDLGVDCAYFGAHKMCGPTGVGALFIKREIVREMSPATFGGGMVWEVSDSSSNFRSDIKKFEAGTGNIAGVIGFGVAVDYLSGINIQKINAHTKEILAYAFAELEKLSKENIIKIYAEKDVEKNVGIISFEVMRDDGSIIHPHDVAQVLADNHVAIRSGHHCAQPLMRKLGVASLSRASFYLYTDKRDVDTLVVSILKVAEKFSR